MSTAKTAWVRSAIVEEEVAWPTDPLSGYPMNYDPRNPDARDVRKRTRSIPFDTKEEAERKLPGETHLLSVVEVPLKSVLNREE